jgi:hypothetical protein
MHTTNTSIIPETVTILLNVVWIVEHLDRAGLRELDDIPVLELAKHITVARWAAA